jgi:uncharacterized protein
MPDKRALLLFSNLPLKEAVNKNILSGRKRNKFLFGYLFSNLLKNISDAKKQSGFDFILATNSQNTNQFDDLIDNIIYYNGKSFGEKFTNSIRNVFGLGYDKVIVIGDDIPDINSELLIDSFKKLNDNSTVVGKSADGGFYLLGMNNFSEKIFENISWRTNKVFKQLIRNMNNQKFTTDFLPTLTDIDDNKSFSFWLSLKTSLGKQIRKILFNLTTNFRLGNLFFIPFKKEEYFSKLLSQKSPPVFS